MTLSFELAFFLFSPGSRIFYMKKFLALIFFLFQPLLSLVTLTTTMPSTLLVSMHLQDHRSLRPLVVFFLFAMDICKGFFSVVVSKVLLPFFSILSFPLDPFLAFHYCLVMSTHQCPSAIQISLSFSFFFHCVLRLLEVCLTSVSWAGVL